jgi:hypothetical protein
MDDTRGLLSRKTRMSKIQFYRSLMAAAVAPTLLSGRIRRAVSLLTVSLGALGISSQMVIAQSQVTGQWETLPYLMPINPIRISLMHTGKIVVVAGSENDPDNKTSKVAVWNPATGVITVQELYWDVFCNGGCALTDGKIMIAGGTATYDAFTGLPRVALFDPATEKPFDVQSMAHGRWYATVIELSDGRAMVFSGYTEKGVINSTVELYTEGTGWTVPYQAPFTPSLYPWLHLLPNGLVIDTGAQPSTHFFNPATRTWTSGPGTYYKINRTYGTSTLLPLLPENSWHARVMIAGGGTPTSTATTEIYDDADFEPSGNMPSGARLDGLSVLLPDGRILECGGSKINEDGSTATLGADLYNTFTGTWSSAGKNVYPRLYHSTALLLPDGRVALMGSNPVREVYDPHIEIYSPDYLFKGARPVITSAPATLNYTTHWTILTPNAPGTTLPDVAAVRLMRPGSTTHSFDMDQRLVGLRFTLGSGAVSVDQLSNPTIFPPGYYMIFILNKAGVPSLAHFIQVR